MIVPRYWAEARRQQRTRGRQVTVRRFGWSDDSPQAAQAHAEQRVDEAFARVLAGEALPRREHKRSYNGAEGLPIREEIVERHGAAVVTRNSYGALCLNSPDVLFVDIDFDPPEPEVGLRRAVRWPLLLAAVALGVWTRSWLMGLTASMAALALASTLIHHIHRHRWYRNGGPERRAAERLEAFLRAHPDWRFRRYRTPAGLRLLAMHRTFDPNEPAVKDCFDALEADRVYALMCQRQHCFRARVSPKPWRIGIGQHVRPRPGVWPIRPERLPERQRWVEGYERVARGYAACRFLDEVGSGPVDAAAASLRDLHDTLCRAATALPIA